MILPFKFLNTATYNGHGNRVMHACGQHSHVAIWWSGWSLRREMKIQLQGLLNLFSTAEKEFMMARMAGAELMVKEGVWKMSIDFGLPYLGAEWTAGKIGLPFRPFMAAVDNFGYHSQW